MFVDKNGTRKFLPDAALTPMSAENLDNSANKKVYNEKISVCYLAAVQSMTCRQYQFVPVYCTHDSHQPGNEELWKKELIYYNLIIYPHSRKRSTYNCYQTRREC